MTRFMSYKVTLVAILHVVGQFEFAFGFAPDRIAATCSFASVVLNAVLMLRLIYSVLIDGKDPSEKIQQGLRRT